MYAITRLKAARNAWYWAVNFKRRGNRYYKRFYDLKHGGSDRARALAIAWRDRQLASAKVFTSREFHQQRRSNNTSGVPGVHFLRPGAQPHGIWQARIQIAGGKKITKTFSVSKFGERKAFEYAVAARVEMLSQLDDRPYLYDVIAKKFAARTATKFSRNRSTP